jgi:hypothetical protein
MLSGSGSNISWPRRSARDLPVVTTPFGMRGYEALAPWLLAGEIDDFPRLIGAASYPAAVPPPALEGLSWAASADGLRSITARCKRGVKPPGTWGLSLGNGSPSASNRKRAERGGAADKLFRAFCVRLVYAVRCT